MVDIIFDTTVLVDHLRGINEAKTLISKIELGEMFASISVLTELELYSGNDSDILVEDLISLFNEQIMDKEIAKKAGEFRKKYKIKIADSIIAATAYTTNSKLFTHNLKDFEKIKEISVEKPY